MPLAPAGAGPGPHEGGRDLLGAQLLGALDQLVESGVVELLGGAQDRLHVAGVLLARLVALGPAVPLPGVVAEAERLHHGLRAGDLGWVSGLLCCRRGLGWGRRFLSVVVGTVWHGRSLREWVSRPRPRQVFAHQAGPLPL